MTETRLHPETTQLSIRQALLTTRIIWLALLSGQIIFLVVVAVIISEGGEGRQEMVGVLFAVALVMLLIGVPAGYIVRSQIYKKNWRADRVAPAGFMRGNVILLGMCEGVAFFALVATLVTRSFGWPLLPGLAAMAVQVINFPMGQIMLGSDAGIGSATP